MGKKKGRVCLYNDAKQIQLGKILMMPKREEKIIEAVSLLG